MVPFSHLIFVAILGYGLISDDLEQGITDMRKHVAFVFFWIWITSQSNILLPPHFTQLKKNFLTGKPTG